MEFTNQSLDKMRQQRALYNSQFANWYYGIFKENGGEISRVDVPDFDGATKVKLFPADPSGAIMFNRGERIGSCMDYWVWDKYEKNRLLDLQKVNRCKNRAFCPNCKMLNVARFIHEFRLQMAELSEKYDFYMLTLTVPNCRLDEDGKELSALLEKFPAVFRRLNRKFSAPLLTPSGRRSSQALQDRYFEFAGGVRVLEITYSAENGFHPHYHIVVLVPRAIDEKLLEKNIEGKYSVKRQKVDYKSAVDVQLGKAWTMLWYGLNFRHWDNYDFVPSEKFLRKDGVVCDGVKNLEVDFVPLDEDGIYEVFKYTFKNSDVSSYGVFRAFVYALENKRFRQGFGVLHNLKCDGDEDGEAQPLELDVPEDPAVLVTNEINELITVYRDYRKISRFNKGTELDGVLKNIDD